MNKPTVKCALIGTLVANHRWGSPLEVDSLLSMSKFTDHEYPKARETVERLKSKSYVLYHRKRGLKLTTAGFETLADVLYYECNWEPFEIKLRLKHYEGWSNHDWA